MGNIIQPRVSESVHVCTLITSFPTTEYNTLKTIDIELVPVCVREDLDSNYDQMILFGSENGNSLFRVKDLAADRPKISIQGNVLSVQRGKEQNTKVCTLQHKEQRTRAKNTWVELRENTLQASNVMNDIGCTAVIDTTAPGYRTHRMGLEICCDCTFISYPTTTCFDSWIYTVDDRYFCFRQEDRDVVMYEIFRFCTDSSDSQMPEILRRFRIGADAIFQSRYYDGETLVYSLSVNGEYPVTCYNSIEVSPEDDQLIVLASEALLLVRDE